MATVHIVLANVSARSDTGGTIPVCDSVPDGADTITSSAVSAVSALVGQPGSIWAITAKDGDVWVKCGPGEPVAAAEGGWLVTVGQTLTLAVTAAAEKLAVKDA